MEKKLLRIRREREFPAGVLFLGGFLLGVTLPNLIWRMEWRQTTVSSMYLLSNFASRDVSGLGYFAEVLRMRGSYVLLCVLCGFSAFGLPLAFLSLLLMGVEIGALLSVSVLEFGLTGGVVGIGLLFPQYLLYLPANLYLSELIYHQSGAIWKNQGAFPERVSGYLLRALAVMAVYAVAILLESYANPLVVEKLMEYINFF